ncbi:hypothetical protein CK203_020634 [Vitis vinifera]|uniref:K Homology domain-containing protein n=1 Tax=Vitis vinifera TaxID=29760 RepID=A0A438FMU7_VITVI|nr:hypothetical protein CK203_020634 [Vitis vinifera]
MATQSTNKGRRQIHSFVIEVPVGKVDFLIGKKRATIDGIQHSSGASIKIESRPCFAGTNRRAELRGTSQR